MTDKLKVERERLIGSEIQRSTVALQDAAASMHAEGTKYKGSMAFHIYEIDGSLDMIVKSQICLDDDVGPAQAWVGMKELMHAARKQFGFQEKELEAQEIPH
jgi:hypothetical protein